MKLTEKMLRTPEDLAQHTFTVLHKVFFMPGEKGFLLLISGNSVKNF